MVLGFLRGQQEAKADLEFFSVVGYGCLHSLSWIHLAQLLFVLKEVLESHESVERLSWRDHHLGHHASHFSCLLCGCVHGLDQLLGRAVWHRGQYVIDS